MSHARIPLVAVRRTRWPAALITLAAVCALAACATAPPPKMPTAPALLALEIFNLRHHGSAPVAALVTVQDERGALLRYGQAAQPADPARPGAGAEFLFAFDLPAGSYRIREIAARIRAGVDEGLLRHEVDIPFASDGAQARYMGRLVMANVERDNRFDQPSGPPEPRASQHRFGLADGTLRWSGSFDAKRDVPRFARAHPTLLLQDLQPVPLTTITVPRAIPGAPPLVLNFAQIGRQPEDSVPAAVNVARLIEPTTTLPRGSAAAQRAWRLFIMASTPRAFAMADDGAAWGWAARRDDAWLVALSECAQRGSKCRLIALDHHLLP